MRSFPPRLVSVLVPVYKLRHVRIVSIFKKILEVQTMNNELKKIAPEQLAETQPEEISVKVKTEVDKMLLKIAQSIIDSDLTEGQKMLRIYDIFEASLQEYHGAKTTLERLCDDCNVDDKKMSADMTRPQSELNQNLRQYIDNIRKIIEPIGEYLHDNLMYEKIPESYCDQLRHHYKNLNNWDADIRSNAIRSLKRKMRGFKFKNKKRSRTPIRVPHRIV